jgi:CysZ protein
LFEGAAYPFRGARFVYVEHRALARYWLPPIVLATLATVLAVWLVLHHRDSLLSFFWSAPPIGDDLWSDILRGLRSFLGFVITALALAFGVIAALFVSQVAAAPFHEALSHAVELIRCGTSPDASTLAALIRDALRSIQMALAKLVLYVALMLPLWIGSVLVPGVGAIVASGAGFAITVAFVALDHLDWAASRHGLRVRERIGLLRAHPAPLAGFGLSVWALLFVPVVNLALMPAAVAGGTLLFIDLRPRDPPRS